MFRLSGIGRVRASASAAAREEALGKRAAGSFARQRRMTIDRAGGICSLMPAGAGGISLRCCVMTIEGLSPWKGTLPVQIS
jgi:hypothetical protein